MSKKHYIAMAKELSNIPDLISRLKAASMFAKIAKADNPRFDINKFFAACGI